MDYNQILDAVIKLILIPAIPYLGKWIRKLVMVQIERTKKELEKYELEKFIDYSVALEGIVENTVMSLKADPTSRNSLDMPGKTASEVKRKVKEQITEEDKKVLQARLNDYEAYIDILVDNALRR